MAELLELDEELPEPPPPTFRPTLVELDLVVEPLFELDEPAPFPPEDESEAYVFVDGGSVWYEARYGFPTQKLSLGSAGGGFRLAVASKTEFQLEAARTLPNVTPFLDRNDTRVIFSVRTIF